STRSLPEGPPSARPPLPQPLHAPQVVVERYPKEQNLPPLPRPKFLVSQELPLSQLAATLRSRLCLASSQSFYLLAGGRALPAATATMQELYREHRDEDGFLYLTYASQEAFGC
ncbi:MLP3C protein, partial [Nothoprocta ornata]|nr:MLP3C protein [Nothoprocta ornata]